MRPHFLGFLIILTALTARLSAAPVVTTSPATEISPVSARLAGTANVGSSGLWLLEFQLGKTDGLELTPVSPAESYYIDGAAVGADTQAFTTSLLSLEPATKYYYRFSLKNADTKGEVHQGQTLTFTTQQPEVSNGSPKIAPSSPPSSSHTGARLNARITSGNSPTRIILRYGNQNPPLQTKTIPTLQAENTTVDQEILLADLTPTSTCFYQWVATNTLGTASSEVLSFTTSPAPNVITGEVTEITSRSATLHASVDSSGGSTSEIAFEYGLSPTAWQTAPSQPSVSGPVTPVTAQLQGLRASSTYSFRVRLFQPLTGTYTYGQTGTFVTAASGEAPTLTGSPSVRAINSSHALVTVPAVFTGTYSTELSIEFGTSSQLGERTHPALEIAPFGTSDNVEIPLTALAPDTLYHFRVRAKNASGPTYSPTFTFRTLPAPLITTGTAQNIGDISSDLAGTFELHGGSIYLGVQWGLSTAYGETFLEELPTTESGTVSRAFTASTRPSEITHYRHIAFDGFRFYYGADRTFTSTAPSSKPAILHPQTGTTVLIPDDLARPHLSADAAGLTAIFHSGGSPATMVFEYGTTAAFGQEITVATPDRLYENTPVSGVLTNLTPATTYFWRARASNSSGGVHTSTLSFTTQPAPTVATLSATAITDLSATLSGEISPNLWAYDLEIAYGTNSSLLSSLAPGVSPATVDGFPNGNTQQSTQAVTATITGLLPSTRYFYQLRAKTKPAGLPSGTSTYSGSIHSFTSAAPATLPSVAGSVLLTNLSDTSIGLVLENFSTGSSQSTVSIEYGTTGSYGQSFTHPVKFSTSTTSSPEILLPGLSPSTGYHARVKITNSQGTYYSHIIRFTTLATGAAPTFTDPPVVQDISRTNARIYTPSTIPGGAMVTVRFDYGTTTAYGKSSNVKLSAGSSPTYTSIYLSNLLPGTDYHYRITASSVFGSAVTEDAVFTTNPHPLVATGEASSVTDVSAVINGVVNPNGTSASGRFQWGETADYGQEFLISFSSYVGFESLARSHTITGLKPGTTYHYRFSYGGFSGEDMTFTTPAPYSLPATAELPVISDITLTSVAVGANGISTGGSPAKVSFEYGTSTNYGQVFVVPGTLSLGPNKFTTTQLIRGLLPDTIYHIRTKITNSLGTAYSENLTFSTSAYIETRLATAVTSHGAVFHGVVNPGGLNQSLVFRYGTTPQTTSVVSATPYSVGGVETLAVGSQPVSLQPNTTYYYRLYSTILGYSPTLTLKTPDVSGAPSVTFESLSVSQLYPTSAFVRFQYFNSGSAQTNLSFEYGTTSSYGSSSNVQSMPPGFTYSTPSQYLSDLLPETLYHVRAKAENIHGTAYSNDYTFTTPKVPVFRVSPATDITAFEATFNGTVQSPGSVSGNISFFYKVDDEAVTYFSTVATTLVSIDTETGISTYRAEKTFLQPDTPYVFKLGATSETTTSEELRFRTLAIDDTPSFRDSVFSYETSDTSALLNFGNLLTGTSGNAAVTVEYGTTPSYGTLGFTRYYHENQSVPIYNLISGLLPETTYYGRVRATNGHGTTYSDEFTFTTLPAPILELGPVLNITDISATLTATINPKGRGISPVFRLRNLTNPSGAFDDFSLPPMSGDRLTEISLPISRNIRPGIKYQVVLQFIDTFSTLRQSAPVVFTTSSPITPPTLSGPVTASQIRSTSAYISLNSSYLRVGGSEVSLSYEFGTSGSFGQIAEDPGSLPLSIYTVYPQGANLPNLLPDTLYYVRPVATNLSGTVYGETITFRTLPLVLPRSLPAENISVFTARLKGKVDDSGNFNSHGFEYGLTSNYGSYTSAKSVGTENGVITADLTLGSLTPETRYHFRYRVRNAQTGEYHYGENMTFTTLPRPPTLAAFTASPALVTNSWSSVTISGKCFTGSTTANIVFEYGTSSALANSVSVSASAAPDKSHSLSITIPGLSLDTQYFGRFRATDSLGTVVSSSIAFHTDSVPSPFGLTAYDITAASATLAASVQAGAGQPSLSFQWGETTGYGRTASASGYPDAVAFISSGLLPNTTYHFRLVARNGNNYTYSEDQTFKTAPSMGPPVMGTDLRAENITADAATLHVQSPGDSSLLSFEYGTTPALGRQVAARQSYGTGISGMDFSADATDLMPDTLYHYRCTVTNNKGSISSATRTFHTLPLPTLTIRGATGIFGKRTTLHAEINANGNSLIPNFEIGTSANFGPSLPAAPALLTGNFPTGVLVDASNLQPDTTYHYRLAAVDTRGRKYHSPAETFSTLSLVEDWRRTNFGIEANAGIAADMASPFGDDTPNLLKFALGLAPSQQSPDMLRQAEIDGKRRLALSFTRDAQKTDLTYAVETNDSLTGNWETIATSTHGEATAGAGIISEQPSTGSEITVEVSDTVDMSSLGKRFIRLKVTRDE